MTQMNIFMKQKQAHREQTSSCQRGGEGLRVWDQQMQTSIYRIG